MLKFNGYWLMNIKTLDGSESNAGLPAKRPTCNLRLIYEMNNSRLSYSKNMALVGYALWWGTYFGQECVVHNCSLPYGIPHQRFFPSSEAYCTVLWRDLPKFLCDK